MVDLPAAGGEDAAQDHAGDIFRVGLGIGQGQGAAPRAAEQQHLAQTEVTPELFDIGDQVRRVVAAQLAVGPAQAAATLVMEHDMEFPGIEIAEIRAEQPAPGPPCRTMTGMPWGVPPSW